MIKNRIYSHCSKCGHKLKKRIRGKNVFNEIVFDLVCPFCNRTVFVWEDICHLKEVIDD